MRKRLTALLFAFVLLSTLVIIVRAPGGSNQSDQSDVIESLEDLLDEILELPPGADGFKNPRAAEGHRKALCNKIRAVIHQAESGAYGGAVNKLRNDIKNMIEKWVNDQWLDGLIEKVDDIIELIEGPCKDRKPPTIVWVHFETPNYDENAIIRAYVTDNRKVASVSLVYSANTIDSGIITMEPDEEVEDLYVAEIPSFPYSTTVEFVIHTYDCAGNHAISDTYSYVVIDSYPPVISRVDRIPASPSYTESVTVLANVIEPPEASGVKDVMLLYRTDGEWQPVEMTLDQLYNGTIPSFPYGTTVQYKIRAFDYADNWVASDVYSYTVGIPPPNLLPVAIFTESATVVPTGEIISFDASESYDPDGSIVGYFWDFGDGTDTTGIIVDHAYADDGVYTVILNVTDNDGATAAYDSMKVVLNRPPVASFIENATMVLTGDVIHFDASESHDPDGTIDEYFWDFGDGTNATGVIVNHAYASTGTFTVTLKVTDDDGAVDFASSPKTVLPHLPPNQPPLAVFTESATTVFTNEIIKFDASASYDPDGTIDSHSWDFGDGNVATGILVEHAYADDGTYDVTLTVIDDDGATGTATSTKYVWNRPPVAIFTESATVVPTGEIISFDASESYDPDGSIVGYFWDFGDGTNTTGIIVDHAYADDGVYTVILNVTDNDGLEGTVASIKTVLNRPPNASFTVSATTVLTGVALHFDASSSEDLDGRVIHYIWDFGDRTNATGETVSHAYEDDGAYTVTLTVIDDDGATSSNSAVETVLNRVPVALFTENVTIVEEDVAIHFDASESHDADGTIYEYFWDFGDGTNATDVAVDHAYAEDGNYTVTLTVTDNDGASSSVSATVTVEAPTGWPLALLAAIGLGVAALTATLLYALHRRRKRGRPASKVYR